MRPDVIEIVKQFLMAEPRVKFSYLFGSLASQTAGPLSDVDIAVYLDARVDMFQKRLLLMDALAKRLGSERFDLVVLNRAPIVLKFEVIRNGIVLKEDRARRVVFETHVLRDYLGSAHLRATQYQYLKENLLRGGTDG